LKKALAMLNLTRTDSHDAYEKCLSTVGIGKLKRQPTC